MVCLCNPFQGWHFSPWFFSQGGASLTLIVSRVVGVEERAIDRSRRVSFFFGTFFFLCERLCVLWKTASRNQSPATRMQGSATNIDPDRCDD